MNIYGVQLKERGKIYYFNGNQLKIALNVTVIVETEKGLQFGKVISIANSEMSEKFKENIKNIVRISTKQDYDQYLKNLKDAKLALEQARKLAQDLKLEMNFISAEFTFDRKQLLLSFYADDRIDFRELAKKLAAIYRTRIELRQVGARDKASQVGGIGPCGRELCCSSFLTHLESVSMNMAKNQNIALNPSKINGSCGRLLCCFTYEDAEYSRCQKGMPSIGEKVMTSFGEGIVSQVDVLNRKFIVMVNGEYKEIKIDEESIK
ncbi:MAG: stage 0 sporulation protein [Bacilli bacterium]|jgi:cell fate regulator YaaT (PSP1 superfamily)|nr:stage 0 sporulation protein [Bacilli bacterium]